MKKTVAALSAIAFSVALATPAQADPIVGHTIGCQAGNEYVRVSDDSTLRYNIPRWPVGGVQEPYQHAVMAEYVKIKVGVGGNWVYTALSRYATIKDTDRCVLVSEEAFIPWNGEKRVVVKTYDSEGNWVGTTFHYNIPN